MITNTRGILQSGQKKECKRSQTQWTYYKTARRKKANDHKHKGHITKRREERRHMITNTRAYYKTASREKANDHNHKHKGQITNRRGKRNQMITNTRGILQNGETKQMITNTRGILQNGEKKETK